MGSTFVVDEKMNKNTRNQKFSIVELGDKNSLLDHQNLVGVVKENKYLNCNSCYSLELSECHEKLNF